MVKVLSFWMLKVLSGSATDKSFITERLTAQAPAAGATQA
jgi:hypothetical protein